MEIRVIGTWNSKLSKNRRNTSYIINNNILMDCGPHTAESFINNGIKFSDIDIILISHMHLDHYGGLPEFIWQRAFESTDKKIMIIGPDDIEKRTHNILNEYYTPDYFKKNIEFNGNFENIIIGNGKHSIKDYTYRLEIGNKTLFYTGDTSYSEEIIKNGYNSDIFIHEATYPSNMEDIAAKYGHSTVNGAYKSFKSSRSKIFIPTHMSELSLHEIAEIDDGDILLPEENKKYVIP